MEALEVELRKDPLNFEVSAVCIPEALYRERGQRQYLALKVGKRLERLREQLLIPQRTVRDWLIARVSRPSTKVPQTVGKVPKTVLCRASQELLMGLSATPHGLPRRIQNSGKHKVLGPRGVRGGGSPPPRLCRGGSGRPLGAPRLANSALGVTISTCQLTSHDPYAINWRRHPARGASPA